MARGFDTLGDIERAIGELRGTEETLSKGIEETNEARTRLLRERTQLYRQVAEMRAKSALADGVIDEADKLESDVEAILAGRQRTIASLKAAQAEIAGRHQALIAESNAQIETIAGHERELDRIAEQARGSLIGQAAYDDALAKRNALAAQVEQAEAKVLQAKATRTEKGKPYEGDPLFMYLWQRNYRQPGYAAMPVVRLLDDWVARLVGYQGARANYAMLLEIPKRLEEHVKRLAADRHLAASAVEELEARRIQELAGGDATRRLQEARSAQTAIDAKLSAVDAELNQVGNQLNRYAVGSDDTYKLAIDMLTAFLEKDRYNRLVVEARWTPETADDELIAKIGVLNRDIERLEGEARLKRAEIETMGKRREEMIRLAAEFRRKSYHQPGSVFEPDYDMQDLLRDVLRGALTVAEYWVRAQRRQRWDGRAADPFRRQSGFPPFDFDFGGFGGGGRRGGGGGGKRDDGGFRTGGGF